MTHQQSRATDTGACAEWRALLLNPEQLLAADCGTTLAADGKDCRICTLSVKVMEAKDLKQNTVELSECVQSRCSVINNASREAGP
eukprot:SAG31_NODE_820_length_11808_cov_16.331540_9_plen_86_part_00